MRIVTSGHAPPQKYREDGSNIYLRYFGNL